MRARVRRLDIHLSEQENIKLGSLMKETGLNASQLIRKLIMQEEIRPRPPDEYRKILFELSSIGNNVNQIAHIANSRRDISIEKINEAVELVYEAISFVRELS